MNKEKRNLVILSSIVLLAVLVWIRGFTVSVRPKQSPGSATPVTASLQVASAPPSHPERFPSGERSRSRFNSWGRDPFVLEGELAQGIKGLVLDGIVWDEQNPLAMINDEVLRVGDTIGNSRIVNITQTEVTLKEGGSKFTLRLGGEVTGE